MTTKYRNGLTNIGLYCGFARDLGNGFIRVQQKSWHRMGLVFALDDGVRGPTHEFEPVTVIFQAIPGRDGEQPTYHALYVTRMGQVSPAQASARWSARHCGAIACDQNQRRIRAGRP